eukprot:TRINITY_DN37263_c0_g1_i1.p1 TRINITY_DN37263_c0_g1~~TRINITY_DN37263_c0_g1_i1.p1  ORF type:complete len:424 (+),score=103.46 TRINITY_DN37263_c0_g1_i1:113-1384(+)
MTSALPSLQGSNAGRFNNVAPWIPAAGKVQSDPLDNVGTCVKHTGDRPDTPERVMPFRKSRQEVGRSVQPRGKAGDPGPPDVRFGKRNTYDDNALLLIQPDTRCVFLQKQQALSEQIYHTTRNEPLGTRRVTGQTPEKVNDPKTRFGKVTKTSENSKAVIYPYQNEDDEEEAKNHHKYCRTHNSYHAGEQKKRDYHWAKGINPKEHRFGYVEQSEVNGVKGAMSYGGETGTAIVQKTMEDFKDITRDTLGKPKNHGFGNERTIDRNFTFGKKNTSDDWGVRECMVGNLADTDMNDPKLGVSTRPGFRNVTHSSEDAERAFGIPSVRIDKKRPTYRKVTDNNNYGDDCNALSLICPSKYASKNVHEEDFLQPILKEDMYHLAQKSCFGLEDDEFDEAWALASTYTQNGSVSIETFRRAVEALDL